MRYGVQPGPAIVTVEHDEAVRSAAATVDVPQPETPNNRARLLFERYALGVAEVHVQMVAGVVERREVLQRDRGAAADLSEA